LIVENEEILNNNSPIVIGIKTDDEVSFSYE
jgi:hypothetical protein